MSVFSKFASSAQVQSDWDKHSSPRPASHHDWSLPPNQQGLSDVSEHLSNVSHFSGSTSAHARHLGSFTVDNHGSRNSGSRAIPTSLENQRFQSHISVSSDDYNSGAPGPLELRAENERLKRHILELQYRAVPHPDSHNEIFDALRDAINETRDEVQKIALHIAKNFTGQIPGVTLLSIPLTPKMGDYNLRFWKHGPWQAIRNGAKVKDIDASVLTIFFEYESGEMASDEVKVEVRGDLFAYWIDMCIAGEMPVHYAGLGLKRREDYRKTMEDKYPWLRLCEGHWKVRQIWTNYYKKCRVQALAATITKSKATIIDISSDTEDSSSAPKKNRNQVPIDVSSDHEDHLPAPKTIAVSAPVDATGPGSIGISPDTSSTGSSSTGSKRGRQATDNLDVGSTKKFKQTGTATSGFHPPRPQPRKKNQVNMGKTDPFAKIRITPTVSEVPPTMSNAVASGSGTVHSSPPPVTNVALASILPGTPSVQTAPVASGIGILHPSLTPEQTPCTTPQNDLDAFNTSIGGPLTQIRAMLEDFPSSPTHESSPVPTGLPTPKITPIITPIHGNGNDQDADSATESSNSPEPIRLAKKSKKGPIAWKGIWCDEWQKVTGGSKAGFEKYLKGVSEDEKDAKVKAIKAAVIAARV